MAAVPTVKEVAVVPVMQEVEVVPEIKTEVKTEPVEPDYPNYMESIETVINASTKAKKPKPAPAPAPVQTTMGNQLPYNDHQYSRITFYGTGMKTIGAKVQENPIKEEKVPAQPRAQKMPKPLIGKAPTVNKPRQKTRQAVRAKPISYRFKPNNGLQQPTPVYFVPSIAATTSTYTACQQHTPPVVQSVLKPMPCIYANGTMPLQFRAPVAFVPAGGPVIQQPIYYLLCNPPK